MHDVESIKCTNAMYETKINTTIEVDMQRLGLKCLNILKLFKIYSIFCASDMRYMECIESTNCNA